MDRLVYHARMDGSDELELTLEIDQGEIRSSQLKAIGCPELLQLVVDWRPRLKGRVEDLPLPEGNGHEVMLLREVLLKAKGQWQPPYTDEELCHCRVIPTAKVEQAILRGAKSVDSVSRQTAAGTGCGTCRPNIQKLIKYRAS